MASEKSSSISIAYLKKREAGVRTEKESMSSEIDRMLPILRASVRRNCPAWMGNAVDDLVQNASIKIMEILSNAEGKQEFSSSYLWRVGYSVVVDEIRRQRRRREKSLEEEEIAHETRSPAPDPETLAASSRLGEGIRSCLARLEASRRQALSLRLLGHSVREVAGLLEWPYKRAENLIYRGLQQLRSCLHERGIRP